MRVPLSVLIASLGPSLVLAELKEIPDAPLDILYKYCIDCHDDVALKGDLSLDVFDVDWTDAHSRELWTEVLTRVDRGKMPPKQKPQLTAEEKEQLLAWLDQELVDSSPVGGAPFRRLNRREISNTLQSIFPIPRFELPPGFPPDNKSHGFDTVSEALVISANHLEAYRDTAALIADYFFPQPRTLPESNSLSFDLDDFAISYSSSAAVDGAMRLASKGIPTRNETWLSRFEAQESGRYRVEVKLSSKNPPPGALPELHLQANTLTAQRNSRSLATFKIQSGKPQTFAAEVDLYRGETLFFGYKNAPFEFGDKRRFTAFMQELFEAKPELAAAWDKLDEGSRGVARGGTGWERLKEEMAENPKASKSSSEIRGLARKVGNGNTSSGETIIFKFFEEGPNIGIHSASIEGPFALVEDDELREQARAKERFLGKDFTGNDKDLKRFFTEYLGKVFRRPATEAEVNAYVAIVKRERKAGYTLDEGMHLAIRTSLLSSNFLYKESGSSLQLSPYELASRLSYFLTSRPPDSKLLSKAEDGSIMQPEVLAFQAKRLLEDDPRTFASDFTSLWLDTHLLDTIMPDVKLLRHYDDNYRDALKEEVILNFKEILTENRSITNFINPDFLYTNETIGGQLYELAQFKPKDTNGNRPPRQGALKRIEIPRDTRHGGLLGMPAVMIATANGVDTQPIIRGVWMLEKIIGRPPPEAPSSVPALSPDLSGAVTLKDRLNAHMADVNCASCHQEIDPVGFVFENYDAVGKWRTEYPPSAPKAKPLPVDATGVLPEGTPLNDVTDLKKWLVEHPEHFANCLSGKLMLY
ncbi:MAG: DUF1588 domain-containing protein, partial [Verrucomicrobiota bacterium]